MKHLFSVLAVVLVLVFAQGRPKAQAQGPAHWQADLTQPQPYVLKRVSSADPTGGNADFRSIEPGATLTVFDVDGPAVLTHLWFTLYDPEPYHLKKLVLRMYWDGEATPSVETPLGDFFGLGLGDYHVWESELLSVANERALNCFFLMPFQKHAREASARRYAVLSCAVSPSAAQSWLDQQMGIERRSPCRRQEEPGRRRELRLDGGQGPRPVCRCDHVGAAKSRRLVGRRRRHVFHRRRISSVHQRNGLGGLFSWRVRFWPQCFLLSALRRPGQGRRTGGQSLFGLSLSP